MASINRVSGTSAGEPAPSLGLMHAAFVLAGFGTLLLGPILPLLATRWRLNDSESGLLLLAQFLGATLGGSTTSRRLRQGLMVGLISAAVGFLGFAVAPGLWLACVGLFVGGFGNGRVIATINIMAGARYTANRGVALSWLNFSWSLGALLSPLSAAWLVSRLSLEAVLAGFAGLFVVVAAGFALQLRGATAEEHGAGSETAGGGVAVRAFVLFAALLVLYGGLETSLAAWLTTYALRYGSGSLLLSEYTTVLFLAGLTCGRALAAWLLRHLGDRTMQRVALVLTTALGGALAAAHTAPLIAAAAVLLGVALAPIFPATFAIVLAQKPSASQAGMILAASGIGAAALPWAMGVVSTRSGSLQFALALPVAAAVAMLALTFSVGPQTISTLTEPPGKV